MGHDTPGAGESFPADQETGKAGAWRAGRSRTGRRRERVSRGRRGNAAGISRDSGYPNLHIPLGDSAVPYSADQSVPEVIGCIRLSLNEILRLKSIVNAEMSEARMAFHIAWSKWRRKHQAIARWYRMRRRMKAEQETMINPAFAGAATLCNRNRGRSSGTGPGVPPARVTIQLRSAKAEL